MKTNKQCNRYPICKRDKLARTDGSTPCIVLWWTNIGAEKITFDDILCGYNTCAVTSNRKYLPQAKVCKTDVLTVICIIFIINYLYFFLVTRLYSFMRVHSIGTTYHCDVSPIKFGLYCMKNHHATFWNFCLRKRCNISITHLLLVATVIFR